VNERLQVLIAYLSALASVQATGVKVRDEILTTIKIIEGEIENERKQHSKDEGM